MTAEESWDAEEDIFIRPCEDTKTLVGRVATRREWLEGMKIALNRSDGPDFLTPIQVARPKNIEAEYRLFVVDHRVVAESSYRIRGQLNVNGYVPQEVIDFGELMSYQYSPAPVFVMDIAIRPNGEFKVVETNCFNAAGFYSCNEEKIVRAVTDYVEAH